MEFKEPLEFAGYCLEALGAAIIAGGTVGALGWFGYDAMRRRGPEAFGPLRERLGRSLLVGLQVLLAGDIVHTASTPRTFRSVGVLAAIVLIRTFLTTALLVELTGAFPWRRATTDGAEE